MAIQRTMAIPSVIPLDIPRGADKSNEAKKIHSDNGYSEGNGYSEDNGYSEVKSMRTMAIQRGSEAAISPAIPTANSFGVLAMEADDVDVDTEVIESRDVDAEAIESDDGEIPMLPTRDENGKLVDKRGIEREEKRRRESRDVDVGDVGGEARSSGGDEEQARRARVRAAPGEPTKAERDRPVPDNVVPR